jgi:ribosomal protein L37AE/L43A
MARCTGRIPVSAKVDRQTQQMLNRESNRLGVYQSEVIRRLIDTYQESREGEMQCPHCGGQLTIELEQ